VLGSLEVNLELSIALMEESIEVRLKLEHFGISEIRFQVGQSVV